MPNLEFYFSCTKAQNSITEVCDQGNKVRNQTVDWMTKLDMCPAWCCNVILSWHVIRNSRVYSLSDTFIPITNVWFLVIWVKIEQIQPPLGVSEGGYNNIEKTVTHKNRISISIIFQYWNDTGCQNPSSAKTRVCWTYTINTMHGYRWARTSAGARASAGVVLTNQLFWLQHQKG